MTPERLKAIKARCEAATSVPAHCKRCKWFTDLPDCRDEIERLTTDRDKWKKEAGRLIGIMASEI